MKKIFMAAITSALIFATGCSKKNRCKADCYLFKC